MQLPYKVIFCIIFILRTYVAFLQGVPYYATSIFPLGEKNSSNNFSGDAWILPLLASDSTNDNAIGCVTFAPKSITDWHYHPGGQVLLAIDGIGYYQERGEAPRKLRKGDVVYCKPNVYHWHGAAKHNYFTQVAITKAHKDGRVIWEHAVAQQTYDQSYSILEESSLTTDSLERRYYLIASIAALASKGMEPSLKIAYEQALDSRMTINEIKEILIHTSAYCGFPRVIQALNCFIAVLENRKIMHIEDVNGREATMVSDTLSKYARGLHTLSILTGKPQTKPSTGYGAFSPEIDSMLKERIFADLFSRDILTYQDREVATISVLACLGGVAPMLKGHFTIAINLGISSSKLLDLISIVSNQVGSPNNIEAYNALQEAGEMNK